MSASATTYPQSFGVVVHAPKDLRIEEIPAVAPGPGEVRVGIEAGGICGSDMHYFSHGGFGAIRIKQPMVLGHEIAGTVLEVGPGVETVRPGTRVAVNPSRPCGQCAYCREGMRHQCLDMRFMGSAMRFPHVQGGFRQSLTVDAAQAVPIAEGMSMAEAAFAEPLAVCLHAGRQAGPLQGKRVLVTGCGPIGMLSILVARHGGAAEIVATDIAEFPLSIAANIGASRAVNVLAEPDALLPYRADKGYFDVLFEASGNEAALVGALETLRPGGIAVQLGLGGDMKLPINLIVAREIQLRGTFRFDPEFALAVELMGRGQIDVKPLLTGTIPFREANDAFALALDRSRAVKVQLAF
ncbi:MAG TPA: L-idonate 5-dehydrogenase [Xanthobacteraceae bacterium]|nr:L-idonate 5-dehydrogenase [Xanthobacteraceae bacterium]